MLEDHRHINCRSMQPIVYHPWWHWKIFVVGYGEPLPVIFWKSIQCCFLVYRIRHWHVCSGIFCIWYLCVTKWQTESFRRLNVWNISSFAEDKLDGRWFWCGQRNKQTKFVEDFTKDSGRRWLMHEHKTLE